MSAAATTDDDFELWDDDRTLEEIADLWLEAERKNLQEVEGYTLHDSLWQLEHLAARLEPVIDERGDLVRLAEIRYPFTPEARNPYNGSADFDDPEERERNKRQWEREWDEWKKELPFHMGAGGCGVGRRLLGTPEARRRHRQDQEAACVVAL